jgi:cytoskeleton protein RodZ
VSSGDKPKFGSYIMAALALLVAVGIWLFYQNYVQKPSPTSPSASIESLNNQTEESLPVPALPAAERAQQASSLQPSIELALPPAPTADAPESPPAEVSTATTKPAAIAPNVASAVTTPPAEAASAATPAGMANLEFNATQETWVNIVDASDREIYSKTIFAGSRESIDVALPVNITVGNAGATSLSMNDKVIHLAPHSRNNVAHIKLE